MLVSVIIPALNEAENIGRTIDAARRGYPPQAVEVVVADGGSSDGTPERVPPDVRLVHAPHGRAIQMNHGAAAGRGAILLFCHADTLLPAGWYEAVTEALAHPGVSGGCFHVHLSPARGPVLRLLNRLRYPANWRLIYGDQALFTTRAAFDRVGGFPEVPLMEGMEMARALRRQGRLVRLPLRVTTSSRRFLELGPARQAWLNVRCLVGYLYLGMTLEEVARMYRISSREREGA